MKRGLMVASIYVIGLVVFLLGMSWVKTRSFFLGIVFLGTGMILCWSADLIPTTKKKYKLNEEQIQEILFETEKDAIERKVAFMKNERTREIIDLISDFTFEDSLIALHTIESRYPNLTIGRGIEL